MVGLASRWRLVARVHGEAPALGLAFVGALFAVGIFMPLAPLGGLSAYLFPQYLKRPQWRLLFGRWPSERHIGVERLLQMLCLCLYFVIRRVCTCFGSDHSL